MGGHSAFGLNVGCQSFCSAIDQRGSVQVSSRSAVAAAKPAIAAPPVGEDVGSIRATASRRTETQGGPSTARWGGTPKIGSPEWQREQDKNERREKVSGKCCKAFAEYPRRSVGRREELRPKQKLVQPRPRSCCPGTVLNTHWFLTTPVVQKNWSNCHSLNSRP
jgi:hypothetical protein